ncbi:MAG: hypothetical protein KF850_09520 [Labilithrix sp.]|nr:hypothetical protein [Labilithrix sp.]
MLLGGGAKLGGGRCVGGPSNSARALGATTGAGAGGIVRSYTGAAGTCGCKPMNGVCGEPATMSKSALSSSRSAGGPGTS